MRLRVWFAFAALTTGAASPQSPADTSSEGPWVGTITTEGNVTTVVNESGSVWGGTATLVEERSIGVESGEDAYVFGRVRDVYATEDEIFVIDGEIPMVRVYDMQGQHLRDLGRQGQGPGEFERPLSITATTNGRILVLDAGTLLQPKPRISVFGPGPNEVESWPLRKRQMRGHPIMVDQEGTLWVEGLIRNEHSRRLEDAVQAYGPDGPIGEPFAVPAFEYENWIYTYNGREIESMAHNPSITWTIHPHGPLVAGANDRYRFEILSPSGRRTIVERFWDPVLVTAAEEAWWSRAASRSPARRLVRRIKPAYSFLLASESGEIWVLREGPAEMIPDCDPERRDLMWTWASPGLKCMTHGYFIDVFGADGRYLGPVEYEAAIPRHTYFDFIRDDMVITAVRDEAGTIRVKRYRLVLPTGR